jgi:hypothetical protein
MSDVREMVAVEMHAMTGSVPTLNRCEVIADRIIVLLAPYIAKEKRAAFVDGVCWGNGNDKAAELESIESEAAGRFA